MLVKRLENKKLPKVVSTKVTAQDYDLCRKIAREYYIDEKIKSPSVSELTRLVLFKVLDAHRTHGHLDLSSNFNKMVWPAKIRQLLVRLGFRV